MVAEVTVGVVAVIAVLTLDVTGLWRCLALVCSPITPLVIGVPSSRPTRATRVAGGSGGGACAVRAVGVALPWQSLIVAAVSLVVGAVWFAVAERVTGASQSSRRFSLRSGQQTTSCETHPACPPVCRCERRKSRAGLESGPQGAAPGGSGRSRQATMKTRGGNSSRHRVLNDRTPRVGLAGESVREIWGCEQQRQVRFFCVGVGNLVEEAGSNDAPSTPNFCHRPAVNVHECSMAPWAMASNPCE
jgi:hypothetical protein